MVNFKEDEQLSTLNHSCAHLMAQAIKHLYPQAKFWVGPVVAEGFYYDVDLGDDVIRDEDIPKIEKEMKIARARTQSSSSKDESSKNKRFRSHSMGEIGNALTEQRSQSVPIRPFPTPLRRPYPSLPLTGIGRAHAKTYLMR